MTRGSKLVVLGGVGGDAHSVGLVILRRALERSGFRVQFLGTQNTATMLCTAARGADAVLVSNMDGHACYYLHDLRSVQEEVGGRYAVWYLGGHPSIDDDRTGRLEDLGFDRVFHGYVAAEAVVAFLDADHGASPPLLLPRRLDDEREEVLMQWPTGAEARDLRANAAALAERPTLAHVQHLADRDGRTLIHPRAGVPGTEAQADLFGDLLAAGADVLSFQIDSLTRNNSYEELELLLKQSDMEGRAFCGLNGFPAVNHGPGAIRAIVAGVAPTPLQVRHSTRDPRLLAEISFAAGVSGFEGGPLSYNLPYYRNYAPRAALRRWRYVDTLAGTYHRRFGVTIDREFFGALTATLVPPCLAVAVDVLEALLAAEAGVKSVSLGYAEQGARSQDVAAMRALRRVGRAYLDAFSFQDVKVHTVFHQYMGAFPTAAEKARRLVWGSAVTATLSGATRVMVKTTVEAIRIPEAADNQESIHLVRDAIQTASPAEVDTTETVAEEELIVAEATAIIDAALRAGRENFNESAALAVELGYVDVPFSPSLWNAGEAISVRDGTGAVRFARTGRIPLPALVTERHRELVDRRVRHKGRSIEELIEADILRVARGEFDAWPLEEWEDRS